MNSNFLQWLFIIIVNTDNKYYSRRQVWKKVDGDLPKNQKVFQLNFPSDMPHFPSKQNSCSGLVLSIDNGKKVFSSFKLFIALVLLKTCKSYRSIEKYSFSHHIICYMGFNATLYDYFYNILVITTAKRTWTVNCGNFSTDFKTICLVRE